MADEEKVGIGTRCLGSVTCSLPCKTTVVYCGFNQFKDFRHKNNLYEWL